MIIVGKATNNIINDVGHQFIFNVFLLSIGVSTGLKQFYGTAIPVLIILLIVIVVLLVLIFHPTYETNEPKYQQIGGNVPVEIQSNNKFDSSKIKKVQINIKTD